MKEQVKLRAFEKEDLPFLHHWFNDRDSLSMIGRAPMTLDETEELVENMRRNKDVIMAVENEGDELVGWIHLSNISPEHGRAEIGLLLAPEHRGFGYGDYAMREMIDLGFNRLRLHRIYLTTRGLNERAITLYERLGFKVEGTLRDHCFVDGKHYDTIFMGLLKDEW